MLSRYFQKAGHSASVILMNTAHYHCEPIKLLNLAPKLYFSLWFEWNGFTCISDVVSVVEDKTIDLYEIKSSTRVKPDHLYDLAFQTVLEGNGFTVQNISVIHVNNQYVRAGD